MRNLFLQINISVDGFIEDEQGEIDWHFVDDEFETFINQTLHSIDGMIFGRTAFDLLAEYWPTAGSNPGISSLHAEAAALMNSLPKYVLTDRLDIPNWSNSHIIGEPPAEWIRTLKNQPGKDIALFAGAAAARWALAEDLVDECRLILNPALLGSGKKLFEQDGSRTPLRLEEVRKFQSGALILYYRPQT